MKSPFIQPWKMLRVTVFGSAVRLTRKSVICVTILAAIAAVPAWAGSCYVVNPACSANGDGSSWSCAASGGAAGAFNGLPASSSMVRGSSYYFAAGNYNVGNPAVFSTPDNGTSTITWKAVTASDNCTSSGFTSSLVGQAVFGPLEFTSDYWVINGQYNSNGNINTTPFLPAGCPTANIVTHTGSYTYFTCSHSGYGFKIENYGGGDCANAACSPVATASTWFGSAALRVTASDETVEFVEIEGSQDQTQTYCDDGINVDGNVGGQSSNNTYLYNWIHDVGEGNYADGNDHLWLDHNWFQRSSGNGSCHGETLGFRSDGGGTVGTTNLVVSNNFVEDNPTSGTASLNTPRSGTTAYSNWYIFGNVFFCNPAESSSSATCHSGDGFIYNEYLTGGGLTNLWIVNNDFDEGQATSAYVNQIQLGFQGGGAVPYWTNPTIENNIWSNPPTGRQLGFYCGGVDLSGLTWGHNAYFGANAAMGAYPANGSYSYGTSCTENTDSTSSPSNAQVMPSNPYVNAGNGVAGADNFQLLANTSAGANLSNLNPPNGNIGVDMVGHTRTTWSRGALEFGNATTSGPPTPPSGLTAVVN